MRQIRGMLASDRMSARLVEMMRIRGLRTLADVTLPLRGLTVLIGDNGSGKSSILEAFRIARPGDRRRTHHERDDLRAHSR